MRQRGPTATALSPGVYLDNHSSKEMPPRADTPVNGNDITSNSTSGAFTPSVASRLPDLSIHANPPTVNSVNNVLHTLANHNSTLNYSSHQDNTKLSSRYLSNRKLRKKRAAEYANMHYDGDKMRNLHSLKVTIRRTYKPNETDIGHCTIVNSETPVNSDISKVVNTTLKQDHLATPPTGYQPKANSSTVSISTTDSATITEPNLFGPCEPGTKVIVEGVVWLETPGMLVLNIQWRGRTYMGTMLDASRQTFAPTCMDKGIISALSLLRGRKGWSRGSPGSYRSHGRHFYRRHCRSRHRGNTHGSNGCMTTRSAAAAAAAAASSESQSTTVTCTNSTMPSEHDPYSIHYPNESVGNIGEADSDFVISNVSNRLCSTGVSQRGAKGRRRRGAGRRPSRPFNKISPVSEPHQTPDELRNSVPNLELQVQQSLDSPEESHTLLPCIFVGCQKQFSDLLSLRYHFTLGHSAQACATTDVPPDNLEQVINDLTGVDPSEVNIVDRGVSPLLSVCDMSEPSSPPPKLGRAHLTKDRSCDSNDTHLNVMDVGDVDDNIAPPKLHRIASIVDSGSRADTDLSPSKLYLSTLSPSDEPPAPSPAYSDISDDGALSTVNAISSVDSSQTMTATASSNKQLAVNSVSLLPPVNNAKIKLDFNKSLNLSPVIITPSASVPDGLASDGQHRLHLTPGILTPNLILQSVQHKPQQPTATTLVTVHSETSKFAPQCLTITNPMVMGKLPSFHTNGNNNSNISTLNSPFISLSNNLTTNQLNSFPLSNILSRPSSTGSFMLPTWNFNSKISHDPIGTSQTPPN